MKCMACMIVVPFWSPSASPEKGRYCRVCAPAHPWTQVRGLPGVAQDFSDNMRPDKIRTQQTVMCMDFIHEGDR